MIPFQALTGKAVLSVSFKNNRFSLVTKFPQYQYTGIGSKKWLHIKSDTTTCKT